MKKAQRIVSLLLTLAIMATMFVLTPVSASAASLNYKSVVVAVDDEFTVKLRNAKGKAEWSSANEDIATVSDGVITGVSTGKTTVTAKYKGKTYSCKVSVKKYYIEGSKEMSVKETQTLKVKGDIEGKTIKWSSSSPKIASVGIKGKVTARKEGTAKIYATIDGKKYVKVITVTKGLSLNASEKRLEVGEKFTLKANNVPAGKKVTWSSADKSIAAVDSKGRVTAIKNGKTTITAKAGNKKAKCTVLVCPKNSTLTDVWMDLTYENIMSGIEFGMSMKEVQEIKGLTETESKYWVYGLCNVIKKYPSGSSAIHHCWSAYTDYDLGFQAERYPQQYVSYYFNEKDQLASVSVNYYITYSTYRNFSAAMSRLSYETTVENILKNSEELNLSKSGSMKYSNTDSGKYYHDEYVHNTDSTITANYRWYASEGDVLMPTYYILCEASISSSKY